MFLNRCAIWVSCRCNCGWGAQAVRHGDTIDVCGTFSYRSVQCDAPAPAKTSKAITSRLAVSERWPSRTGRAFGARDAKTGVHGWSRRVGEAERRAGLEQVAPDDGGRVSLLEQLMPRFDARSQHAIQVHAPAQAVFTAVGAVTVKEVRFLRELELIRALPGLAATGRLDVPTLAAPLVLS